MQRVPANWRLTQEVVWLSALRLYHYSFQAQLVSFLGVEQFKDL